MRRRDGINNYIRYINTRLMYADNNIISISSNEYYYFRTLFIRLKKWLKNHKLLDLYLHKRITIQEISKFANTTIRNAFRIVAKEEDAFIDYCTSEEIALFAKYPYEEDGTINEIMEEA